MKKFSKKLVSRCVYCNVLQATKPEILSEYLDKGGWETINTWLQYAKSSSAHSFLLEMLKLCKQLPMTLNRLKENNTAKLIKSMTKHENKAVKTLSKEVVNCWMSIIKDKKTESTGTVDKKKKKEKSIKVEPIKEESKSPPKSVPESPKTFNRLKGLKRSSTDKESKPAEIYEDVKIDPEPLMPISKKPRPDRPKTAKIYQKKCRQTGLEEETPLPKNISKKTTTVDKTAAVAAAKNTLKLNTSPLDRITEKKIKPENLMAINENANSKGIKLIPAKPRPTYILQESASFMDALVSQPAAPIRRKKKVQPKTPPPQTSPTIAPPKFQFYKDTLEEKMSEENKKQDPDKDKPDKDNKDDTSENNEAENKSEDVNPENVEENAPMEVTEDGGHTPPNTEANEITSPTEDSESKDEPEKLPRDPNKLQSILSHGRRRSKKKSVKWVDDSQIKEVFYFEMDDTERVNVSRNHQNFGDLKSMEMKRERENMELAKKHATDRVDEFRKWWSIPILIDCPPPLAVPGFQSEEKMSEMIRQQSTLQEIYFTREMIPDSPHEPDLEIVALKEPKVIPLDEDNVISSLIDYSNLKAVKPSLPEILTTLMKLNASQLLPQVTQNIEQVMPIPMDIDPIQQTPVNITVEQPNIPMSLNQPVPEMQHVTTNGLLGHAPMPLYTPTDMHIAGPAPMPVPVQVLPGEWQTPDMPPPNEYFGGFQINQNMPHNPPPPVMNMRAPGGHNFRPNFRGGPRGPGPRSRNRKVCRHFAAGHCRFGMNCTFLHPGVNGPLL